MRSAWWRCVTVLNGVAAWLLLSPFLNAGMPSSLPTYWTKDGRTPNSVSQHSWLVDQSANLRWQAISFFVVCLLLVACCVRWLWNSLRKDFSWLPPITLGRSLSFVVLWGLLFVIVLTMISGARELMTPGAWRKQGWTYKLTEPSPANDLRSGQEQRRQGLVQLRTALWHYAAMHQGRFPTPDDAEFQSAHWNVPGWPGVKYLMAPDRKPDDAGLLLVFEPELEGNERHVLLTNGLLGTMRSAEINEALSKR